MAAPTTRAGAETRRTRRYPCGTHAAYRRGCRCRDCRRARSVYAKRARHGMQPSAYEPRTGTARRIRGLQALGWTCTHIGAAAGLSADSVSGLTRDHHPHVLTVHAEAIRAAVHKLGGTLGPSEAGRKQARRNGYPSLWAWDDNIDDPSAQPEGVVRAPKRTPRVRALDALTLARYERYSVPVLGTQHIRWTGPVDQLGAGKLSMADGHGGRTSVRVRRVAFHRHTGRHPRGDVYPVCGNSWCVAGPCMRDETMRYDQQKAAA